MQRYTDKPFLSQTFHCKGAKVTGTLVIGSVLDEENARGEGRNVGKKPLRCLVATWKGSAGEEREGT